MKHFYFCLNCRRRVFLARDSRWYHDHNASVSCHPGDHSGRRAEPGAAMGCQGDTEATA
jgi:hypothetical protein